MGVKLLESYTNNGKYGYMKYLRKISMEKNYLKFMKMVRKFSNKKVIDINMIKDNIYRFFLSLNSFNVFIFIYFKNKKQFLLKNILLHFK